MQSRNGYKIAGGITEGCGRKNVKGYVEIKASCVSNAKNIIENLCAQAAAPNRTIMNVTTSTADAGKDDSRITKLPAAEEMNTLRQIQQLRKQRLRALKRTRAAQKNSRVVC